MVTDHDGFLDEALGRANSHSPDGEEGSSVMKRPLALKDRLTGSTHAELSLSLSPLPRHLAVDIVPFHAIVVCGMR